MIWDVYLVGVIVAAVCGNKEYTNPGVGVFASFAWPVFAPLAAFEFIRTHTKE